ncbi:MAG: HPP family protein [Gallionellaceae bacterium]
MDINTFLRSFHPHNTSVPTIEKLRSGLAAGIAIFILGLALSFLPQSSYPFLMLGSMAASATLLFAVPHSPMAQPWNLIGGHLISALFAWPCIVLIHDPVIAAAVAVGGSIFVMHYLNCLHPPGAATALTLVLSSTIFLNNGWVWTLLVVAINAFIFLVLALVLNNLLPSRRYPMQQMPLTPHKPRSPLAPEILDIEYALEQMGSVIDVSEEDLVKIYELALLHAHKRKLQTP